jgi:hypothetical protein
MIRISLRTQRLALSEAEGSSAVKIWFLGNPSSAMHRNLNPAI